VYVMPPLRHFNEGYFRTCKSAEHEEDRELIHSYMEV